MRHLLLVAGIGVGAFAVTYLLAAGGWRRWFAAGPEHSFDPRQRPPERVPRGGSFLCCAAYCFNYRPTPGRVARRTQACRTSASGVSRRRKGRDERPFLFLGKSVTLRRGRRGSEWFQPNCCVGVANADPEGKMAPAVPMRPNPWEKAA